MKSLSLAVAVLCCLCLIDGPAWCQTPVPALALASANAALTGGAPVTGAVLTGTVSYFAGSDEETGAVTLEASGFFDSKLTLRLSGGDRTEIQQPWSGAWAGADGVQHSWPLHNSLASSAWFFPALLVEGWITQPSFSVSSVAAEQRNGIAVQHLRCVRILPDAADALTTAHVQRAGAMDLFLDSATFLPVALEFNTHPDNNALMDIPVRIEFSDYRAAGSGKAPFHIQKYLQNTLLLDISLTSVDLNPVIASSDFTLQAQ